MRRLRAPDKSGAGGSGAVSMEERETEEAGGRRRRQKCSHRQRRLPATVYGVNAAVAAAGAVAAAAASLAPGKDLPPRDSVLGAGEREFVCVAVIKRGGGGRAGFSRRRGQARE